MKGFGRIATAVMAFACLISCSTTKVLQDNEYRLAKNEIEILNDKHFNPNQLQAYLKQKPNSYFIFGWNPFLNVYNWQNGKGKGWDKFVTKIGVAPVVYEAEQVDNSILNLENRLEYLGYFDSKVESRISVKRKKVNVTYEVTLGKRYPIKQLSITLPEGGEFSEAFLKDTSAMTVKVGDYLSESALEAETERSSADMRNKGFYTFNKNYYFFEADTLTYPDSALLHLTVHEYTRNETAKEAEPIRKFYFNDVSITYPRTLKIKDKVLKELNTIIPGAPYSSDIVNQTYSRLASLRVFNSVNIGMTKADTNLVDCSISLSQSKLQGFKVNLEGSTNSSGLLGVSPQLSYYHKNIFRG